MDNITLPSDSVAFSDIGFVLTSTALVWIMIPGVGFFYSGMARKVCLNNFCVRITVFST